MSLLNEVQDVLISIFPDEPVDYGMATTVKSEDPWNYVVFGRQTIRSNNSNAFVDRVNVAIIREGYVPDDDIDLCVEKISSIPGMKFDSKSEISFEYTVKANTNALIEMAVIPFTHTRKK